MGSPIKRPGLIDSLTGALTILGDRGFDRRYGTRTSLSLFRTIQDPGTRPPQPTPERVARAALDAVPYDRSGAFLDIGAGSGRVMMLARVLGWEHVVGVEQNPTAVQQARENFRHFSSQSGMSIEGSSVIEDDAAEYSPDPRVRTVFLFNPFGRDTMEAFCNHLDPIAAGSAGQLRVVYIFPVFGNVLAARENLTLEETGKTGGFPWAVFRAVGVGATDRQ